MLRKINLDLYKKEAEQKNMNMEGLLLKTEKGIALGNSRMKELKVILEAQERDRETINAQKELLIEKINGLRENAEKLR